MVNDYSSTWFDIFLSRKSEDQTKKEVDFLLKLVRENHLVNVLDIACGLGRHSGLLATFGLNVTGIDINMQIIREARELYPNVNFIQLDMRQLTQLERESYDLIVILWQSFGYYNNKVNTQILRDIHELLSLNGRFVVDIYNYDFFAKHQGSRKINRAGREIMETKFIKDRRLTVQLDYQGNIEPDVFRWQLYTVDEFLDVTKGIGFSPMHIVTDFDYNQQPNLNSPRVQYVFSK